MKHGWFHPINETEISHSITRTRNPKKNKEKTCWDITDQTGKFKRLTALSQEIIALMLDSKEVPSKEI